MKNSSALTFILVIFLLFGATGIHAQTFVNPIAQLADPYIVYHDGWHYYTGTTGSGITLKKSRTLEGLKNVTLTEVFSQSMGEGPCCDYWAAELHRINNT